MKKIASLYRVELRRLFLSKMTWVSAILCLLATLLGYVFNIYSVYCVSSQYIAAPVMTGTALGAVVWMVLTISAADRPHRSGTDVLTDAVMPPVFLCVARIFALMTVSACVTVVTALVCLPYTAARMSYLFMADFYFLNYAVFMLPTWWISILFADIFYRVTCRVELSVMLCAVSAAVGIYSFGTVNYFLCWMIPLIISYSDGFVSLWPLRIGLYTRLSWLFIATGCFLVSLPAVRKYQRGLIFSFHKARGKVRVLFPSAIAVLLGVLLLYYQPFIDHGPEEFIDEGPYVVESSGEMSAARCTVETNPVLGSIRARAEYDVMKFADGEAVFRLSPGYRIESMTYGGEDVPYRTVDDDINGGRYTHFTLSGEPGQMLVIEYGGIPTLAKYVADFRVDGTVDRDYISLSGMELLPLMEDYVIWRDAAIDITIPDDLTPLLDYALMTEYTDNGDGTRTWSGKYDGYVRNFSAGRYVIDEIPVNDKLTLDFAYGKAYEDIVARSDVKDAVRDVFSYCGEHYGELKWTQDGRIMLQQASVMLMGGYAFPGVSMWFETVLSPDTLSDPDRGSNATEVFIHEMVHQWWGGLGLLCEDEELWSEEGLTVYSTYRIVKERYGEAYAQKYYIDAWEDAVERQNRNFYNRFPEYLELLPESMRATINTSNQGINRYQRMPLMILKAEKLVGGEEKMDEILSRMFRDKDNYDYGNAFSYQDFLDYCGLSQEDLELE